MIGYLQNLLFKKEYVKLNQPTNRDFTVVNEVNSIVILTDEQSYSIDQLKQTLLGLRKLGVRVKGYFLTKSQMKTESDDIRIITPDDVSWSGVPKQEFLVEWLQRRFDLLISANRKSNQSLEYLMASSNCLLKSALVYDENMDRNAQFCLEVSQANSSLTLLCQELYAHLLMIFNK